MKKIILSLAVVFVMSSFTTANVDRNALNEINIEVINPDEDYCSDLYFEVRDVMLLLGHSLHVSISAAIAAESACGDEMEPILD